MLAVLAGVVSIAKDLVINGGWPTPANLGSQLVFMATCAIGTFTHNENYHRFLALFTAFAFSAYTALLFAHLQ